MKKAMASIALVFAALVCTAASSPPPSGGPSQVPWGRYCCDGGGVRRCFLDAYYPVGSWCVCYGQGNGWVCQ